MTKLPFISYAQTMEDVMLWRVLRHEAPCFYIDIGAADPDRLSVTRAFYERGWQGLDVEPLPEQAARLRDARPHDIVVQAAVSDREGTARRSIASATCRISAYRPSTPSRRHGRAVTVETFEVRD